MKRVKIHAVGTGMNTATLVKHAIELRNEAEDHRESYIEVWCVFDRDSFPAQHFRRACDLAKQEGIKLAWSNECFEIWYLLHFEFRQTSIGRAELIRILKKRLGSYSKADNKIFQKLAPKQPDAIRNARRLEKHWNDIGGCDALKCNPSTGVHKLVERLNEFK